MGLRSARLGHPDGGDVVPAGWWREFSGSATPADNVVIYTSPDVHVYNVHYIHVTGSNAADVEVTFDGTNWSTAVGVFIMDNATDALVDVSIPAGKIGRLDGKYKQIRVKQDGLTSPVGTATVVGAHGVI